MIQVTDLIKRYQRFNALAGLSFEVEQGQCVGLLGPNGAGKTTTLRILSGALPASAGKVVVAGFDVFEQPVQVKQRIGVLPEIPALYEELTCQEQLGFVGRLKGLSGPRLRAEVDRVGAACGLAEARGRLIRNLSKGYKQRVGLAQALLGDPQVLILDEPTQGLDPNQIVEIRALIRALSTGHTVLLSTHLLPEVSQLCSRVIILNKGQIVADDTLSHLTATEASLELIFHRLTMA